MINLFLIRGLPSSGKSTLAYRLASSFYFEADRFFENADGEYKFDPSKIVEAHAWCLQQVIEQIDYSLTFPESYDFDVIVANTFATRWEMQPYIKLAKQHDLRLTVVDLFDGGCDDETLFARNKHGVPLETFRTMREEYEHDWRNGNPILPTWE